jgi:hypothetical protein
MISELPKTPINKAYKRVSQSRDDWKEKYNKEKYKNKILHIQKKRLEEQRVELEQKIQLFKKEQEESQKK